MKPLTGSSLTPKGMTLNDLNGHFGLKSGSGSASNGLAFWPFGENYSEICTATHILSAATNKKVQQSWQTSALAMHLPLARSFSIPVIFCLLPSSSIVILVFYLFSTDQWTACVRLCLWVWIQFTGLMLPLRVTPMNNPITLISPVQSLGYIFCHWSVTCVSANFLTVFSESQPIGCRAQTRF